MRYLFFALIVLLSPAADAEGLYKEGSGRRGMVLSKDVVIPYPDRARGLELRITWPQGAEKLPVFIFSHGAFGSQENYAPLAAYIASHGYIVLQPTHADSMRYGTLPLLGNPFSFRNWAERPQEISYLIGKLGLVVEKVPALGALMDQEKVAVGGHSFGAHTVQLLAGMTIKRFLNFTNDKRKSFVDARPLAFVAISPHGTGRTVDEASFKTMNRPALFITGGNDDSPVSGDPYTWRLEAFRLAPPHDKYLLFIDDAWHGFGGLAGEKSFRGSGPPNAAHLNAVLSSTLAFLDAYIKNDEEAKKWLNSGTLRKDTGGKTQITVK